MHTHSYNLPLASPSAAHPTLLSLHQLHARRSITMAAATACASTSLAGQALLRPASELSRKVGANEARVTMRKAASQGTSYWYVCRSLHLALSVTMWDNALR